MYLDFFGLNKSPFKITPDPSLFFSGGKRGEILDAIVYSIISGAGITKVVGEVGSGKTMLCRMLESKLPQHVQIVYIANPSLSPENILPIIALELGLKLNNESKLEAMQQLHTWLLEQHAKAKQVVVFVEEAQCMPIETLEEIRLLSNLETNEDKLLQIVLFGQPELDENLSKRNIRQLKDRISNSFLLSDFSFDEISDYVNHRVRLAGYRGPNIFSKSSIKLIAKYSKGLIRRVNILADKSMLAAFANGQHNITKRHVNLAGIDSQFKDNNEISKTSIVLFALVFTGLISSATTYSLMNNTAYVEQVKITTSKMALPVIKEKVILNKKILAEVSAIENSVAAEIIKEDRELKTIEATKKITLAEYLEKTKNWLINDDPKFTIQLLYVSDNFNYQILDYLKKNKESLNLSKLFIYRNDKKGKISYGILYGDYNSKSDALKSIKSLPKPILKHKPFIRTVNSLKRKAIG